MMTDMWHHFCSALVCHLRSYMFILIVFSLTDILEEIITEDKEQPPLPGPPRPPADLFYQPHGENHARPRQSSSSLSQPVLVARGTACQVSAATAGCVCSTAVFCVVLVGSIVDPLSGFLQCELVVVEGYLINKDERCKTKKRFTLKEFQMWHKRPFTERTD